MSEQSPHTMQSQPESTPVNDHTERQGGISLLGVGLALVLTAAAFFSGLHLGSGEVVAADRQSANMLSLLLGSAEQPETVDMSEFWRVWELLEDKYVSGATSSDITTEDMVRGAIKGLVESYDDPYTVYLPPQDAEYFQEDISGNFSGVGMEVGMRDGVVTIIAPLPDTPADNAGLLAGDKILAVDGESTEDESIDQVVRKIRGEKGTDVTLTILRDGENETRDVVVTRDTIAIPTIETSQDGDIFTIKLFNFNAVSEMRMQEALREYVRSGADKLVLDLRGNPGGFLQSAISISSFFLPTGKVVVKENFGGEAEEKVFRSQGKTLDGFAPEEMVVLIDGGSASASEILAGALGAHDVATLIGQTTFGKGSVQELVDLPQKSSLKVTVARWLTPDGTSISQGGLEPDITVTRTPEQYLAGDDPQMEAALEYLQTGKVSTSSPATESATEDE